MVKGQILNVGSVSIIRSPAATYVYWPGWQFISSEGTTVAIGVCPGWHLRIPNDEGQADADLAAINICGYTVSELQAISTSA